jgi:DNA repair protein RecO (recombination protein O)
MRVLAKGVRKIPSRRGGHLEPLTKILAVVSTNRDWRYVAHAETLDYFSALQRNEQSLQHAHHVSRLLLSVLEEGECTPGLFDYLEEVWQRLPRLPFAKQVLLELTSALTILLVGGVLPNLSACQRCGRTVAEDSVILDGGEGGWHCLSCHGALGGTHSSLPPRLLKVMRYAAARPQEALRISITDEEGWQLLTALRSYTYAR